MVRLAAPYALEGFVGCGLPHLAGQKTLISRPGLRIGCLFKLGDAKYSEFGIGQYFPLKRRF
jgi:hypothetical protein